MQGSPFQPDPRFINAGSSYMYPMSDDGSPFESSAYLLSSGSQAQNNKEADKKTAVIAIVCGVLALVVIGLGTFMAIQISRNDDVIGTGGSRGEGGKGGASDGGIEGISGRTGPRVPRPPKPAPVPHPTTECPPPRIRPRTTRRGTVTPKRAPTTEATSKATSPPNTSKGDQLAAEWINASLDWSYKPCDDFYSFVCSRFEGGEDAFKKLQNYTDRAIKEELLAAAVPRTGQSATQKAAALFQACVNLGSNARYSEVDSLQSYLRPLGLDMSDMRPDPDFNVADRIVQLSFVYGLPAYVEFRVHHSLQNHSQLYIHVEINTADEAWVLAKYYTYHDDVKQAQHYEGYIRRYDPTADTSALATKIVQGEHIVRRTIETLRQTFRPPNSTTVRGLGSWTSKYVSPDKWERMIALYSGNTFDASSRLVLWDDAPAILAVLMDNSRLAPNDSRLLMAWSLLHRLLHLAHGEEMMLETARAGVSTFDAVSEFCYKKVTDIMALAVTKQYLSEHVPPSALASGYQVFQNVRRVLEDKLQNTAWFKDPVRNVSLRKFDTLRLTFGYPKNLSDESVVEALFADFPDVAEFFLAPYLQSLRVLTYRAVRGNSTENFKAAYIDAEYKPQDNSITITAGMMLPPIFILDAAAAMNYGGFGQIVGHEMMHAYDVRGIKLTHEGRSAKYNATDTLQEYERKVLCLRASYQKAFGVFYVFLLRPRIEPTVRVQAEDSRARTLDQTIDAEGFADYTGILLAHEAFRRLADDQRTRTVPDVGLTADQAFFVAHCIKWCNADKVNKTRPFRGAYWHSRSRCIVPLQNMPEFAQAFSCRHGDYMNPDNRCDFW